LQLYTDSAVSIGTRIFIQEALQSYNSGNASEELFKDISEDLKGALSGSGENALLVQFTIYPRSNLTPSGAQDIVGATGDWVRGRLELPYNHTNGTPVFLGDAIDGFPEDLYPNLTYIDGPTNVSRVLYEDRILVFNSVLILGPLYLNNSSSLISITVAINNNTSKEDILGWLTVVMDARLFYDAVASPEGLGSSGEVLIVGPITDDNRFKHNVAGEPAAQNADTDVWYILPPPDTEAQGSRHDLRAFGYPGNPDLPFKMATYPAVLDAWSKINNKVNNAGAYIRTHNEEGKTVSAGHAQINFASVDWILLFEQSYGEVIEPIIHLRNIILACIFAVVGAIVLVSLPVAHCAVRPIRQLRAATQNSITVFQDDDSTRFGDEEDIRAPDVSELQEKHAQQASPRPIFPWSRKRALPLNKGHTLQRHMFHIPQKIPIRRAIVSDELTDLTSTFNEMSDELTLQYNKLEERVKIRTAELEQSRNAAQVANESKTLFVGNISHELRTPLNGILGMCSIALHERDTSRVREALKIIYKSGDLLLHLLNDLLTFSRNACGERLAIEEENFRLVDVGTQITSIFEKQAREAQIDLKVLYLGSCTMHSDEQEMLNVGEDERQHFELLGYGPGRTGLVRDMSLRGDKHRILQILMNLVSNSLKFTPAKGVVEVRIKCLGYAGWELPKLSRAATRLSQRRNSMGLAQAKHTPYTLNQNISEELTNLAFQFEVEDTGPGISEHMQEQIFKPFVQGDLALSKKYGGTGLRLAICSQLAALMQGKITLRSTISVGSTFALSLNLRYVRDRGSSLSTVNDHPHSIPSISKPNSMNLSSLRAPFQVACTLKQETVTLQRFFFLGSRSPFARCATHCRVFATISH
jgi:osomolarity two-component system sensor histidine kinase SLN1